MRKAAYAAAAKEAADIGDRQSTDLTCLRSSSQANMQLAASVLKNKSTSAKVRPNQSPFGQRAETAHDFRRGQHQDKIVAKKSFFLNPHRNDPKIIQTKNRLYVI